LDVNYTVITGVDGITHMDTAMYNSVKHSDYGKKQSLINLLEDAIMNKYKNIVWLADNVTLHNSFN